MTETFVPSGHPVRRFVTWMTAIAALAVAAWWAGVFAPRVSAGSWSSQWNAAADAGSTTVEVHNHAPLAARVVGASFTAPECYVASGPTSAVVGGRTTGTVVVLVQATCTEPSGSDLRLRVRTPSGLARVVTVRGVLRAP